MIKLCPTDQELYEPTLKNMSDQETIKSKIPIESGSPVQTATKKKHTLGKTLLNNFLNSYLKKIFRWGDSLQIIKQVISRKQAKVSGTLDDKTMEKLLKQIKEQITEKAE